MHVKEVTEIKYLHHACPRNPQVTSGVSATPAFHMEISLICNL